MSITDSKPVTHHYALGHSEQEVRRLQKQSQALEAFTRRCLQDAGIRPGMKVLDVGSGAGDVALLLAEMVGPEGQVVGIDLKPDVLELARQRAIAAGYRNISFIAGDVYEIELERDFDALVGRLILFHLKEPVKALRHLLNHLRPGAIVAFQDYDVSKVSCYPPSPLFRQTLGWVMEAFRQAGADPEIGLKLRTFFLEAGLPEPQLRCEADVSGDAAWPWYDQFAGVVRSLLPVILKLQLATAEEVGIDTLAERIRADVTGGAGVGRSPDVISAWTRKAY